ncbi:ABC transporter substrate-binding protein [Dongia soli]|uniref:ABC transporter substrate-binding protein n=1 Tax=Dongia soli TaxID=600628 RepID=A0ABU5EIT7_9PROT|nr:ABC transporter substrate-binding protein [Dongia soli]MDY0885699.1 ABC transporter substrate-binding protein [Dongia soli]
MTKRFTQRFTLGASFALALLASTALAGIATPGHAEEAKNGGSYSIVFKDDLNTLDPAIGYDFQNWTTIRSIFDGLMDYKHGTNDLVTDLAESYEVSPDGLTYTFKLRRGIKFQNGREMKAGDVKYSIDRVVDPKTQSPGAGYFTALKGYDDVASGKANELSGIETPDDYTVVFHLTQPDATMLHIMALNFSYVVPKEEVEKYGADFGQHPVGTGDYAMKEWVKGQHIVLERTPYPNHPGRPHADQITVQFGLEPVVQVLKVQNNEADLTGDIFPPAKFIEVTKNAALKDRFYEAKQLNLNYMTMNAHVKPFDNVKVRQAVSYAINKDRLVKILNNRGTVTDQVLPPAMAGYDANFKGYGYDPAKAKELLKEAGLEKGFETELYFANTDPWPRMGQSIQKDLAAIGVKVSLKGLDNAAFNGIASKVDGTPMTLTEWYADFPDPSNFYTPILGCASAAEGGYNYAHYCNKEIDKRAQAANAIADPAKTAERNAAWSKLFGDIIMRDAPWVPLLNPNRYTLRSDRIEGDKSYFVDVIHQPVPYEDVWVKK